MPTGTAWTDEGTIGLWKAVFKMNGIYHGFPLSFHLAEKTESQARTIAEDIGAKLKIILPPSAEIFYATIAKTDTRKDSRFIPGAVGPGVAQVSAGPPIVPMTLNHERDCLRVRFESLGPQPVTRLFPLLPDEQVEDQELVNPIDAVTDIPVANPAVPTNLTAWATNYNVLLKTLVFSTHHVKTHDTPGGVYTYYTWNAAYPGAIGTKKGGRLFV